jgi:hypothetical protein
MIYLAPSQGLRLYHSQTSASPQREFCCPKTDFRWRSTACEQPVRIRYLNSIHKIRTSRIAKHSKILRRCWRQNTVHARTRASDRAWAQYSTTGRPHLLRFAHVTRAGDYHCSVTLQDRRRLNASLQLNGAAAFHFEASAAASVVLSRRSRRFRTGATVPPLAIGVVELCSPTRKWKWEAGALPGNTVAHWRNSLTLCTTKWIIVELDSAAVTTQLTLDWKLATFSLQLITAAKFRPAIANFGDGHRYQLSRDLNKHDEGCLELCFLPVFSFAYTSAAP